MKANDYLTEARAIIQDRGLDYGHPSLWMIDCLSLRQAAVDPLSDNLLIASL